MLVSCLPARKVGMTCLSCFGGTANVVYCVVPMSNLGAVAFRTVHETHRNGGTVSRNGFGVQQLALFGTDCGNLYKTWVGGGLSGRGASLSSYCASNTLIAQAWRF